MSLFRILFPKKLNPEQLHKLKTLHDACETERNLHTATSYKNFVDGLIKEGYEMGILRGHKSLADGYYEMLSKERKK